MRSKRLYQWGLGTAAAGILLLLVLILSGIAAPNPLFTVLALGGLLFCGDEMLSASKKPSSRKWEKGFYHFY